jgi:cytochrome bd-type quinol oxidase subunit 2
MSVINEIQEQIFWLNLVFMSVAFIASLLASRHETRMGARHYQLVSLLALAYVASYALFLAGVWTRLQWSEVMIIPSLASIVILWIAPAATVLATKDSNK